MIPEIAAGLTSLGNFAEVVRETEDKIESMTEVSLPASVRRCIMLHRVYLEGSIAAEPIIYDVLYNTQSMIAAWAFCALQLNAKIDNVRTTKKLLDVVATESFNRQSEKIRSAVQLMLNKFPGTKFVGMEDASVTVDIHASDGSGSSDVIPDDIEQDKKEPYSDEEPVATKDDESTAAGLAGYSDDIDIPDLTQDVKDVLDTLHNSKNNPDTKGSDVVKLPTEVTIPQGRILTFDLILTPEQRQPTQITTWLYLAPSIVPDTVMEQFISLNFKPTWLQKWIQYKAGEISLISDFFLELNRLEERRKARKQDKTGLLGEMIDDRDNAVSAHTGKLVQYRKDRSNIASSILVYDSHSFQKTCLKTNCDFRRVQNREKFFASTYAMMVIVVDARYETVTMYINGIDATATFTYEQMRKQAKSDKMSVADIMTLLSRNQAPRF